MFMKKLMKKVIALTAIGCIAVASAGCSADSSNTEWSRTTQEYVHDMGMGINLGNTFDCTVKYYDWGTPARVETAWGSPEITQMCPVLWDTPGGEYDRYTQTFGYPEFISKIVGIAE